MINVNPSYSITSGAFKPLEPRFGNVSGKKTPVDKVELKQNLPKAIESKPTGLAWLAQSITNAIAYVFNSKANNSTLDHELGHLLIYDLVGSPAQSISVNANNYKKGTLGGVMSNMEPYIAGLKEGEKKSDRTIVLKTMLNRMLALRAGTVFETQLHPNFFAFMGASSDMKHIKEDFDALFVHLHLAYKGQTKQQQEQEKKKLFSQLDAINQTVFDAIPMKALEGLRAELLDKGEIKGKDNCQDLLRRHLKKEEGFDWDKLRKQIDQELTKLASG